MTSFLASAPTQSGSTTSPVCPVTPVSSPSLNAATIGMVSICRRSTSRSSLILGMRFQSPALSKQYRQRRHPKESFRRLGAHGIWDYSRALDRGFFSHGNLEKLLKEEISFVMLASLTLKQVKEVLTEARRDLENPQYLRMYQQI